MEADGGVAAAGEIGAQQPPVDPQELLAGGAGDAHHAPAGENQVAVDGEHVLPLQPQPGVEEQLGGLDGDGDEDDEADGDEDGHHAGADGVPPLQPHLAQLGGLAEVAAEGQHAGAAAAAAHPQQQVAPLHEQHEMVHQGPLALAAAANPDAEQQHAGGGDAAAAQPQVSLKWLLGALTFTILGVILVADLGIHPTTWAGKITSNTSKDWVVAGFVAVGSVTSLLLSYSRLPTYIAVWREGTAGSLARVVPSVASLLNCLAWVSYGFLLDPANVAMIVVNLTDAAFHIGYITVYVVYSGAPKRIWVLIMLLAAGAGGAITAIDLHGSHGMELPDAVGSSAVDTACVMYCMPLLVLGCQLWFSGSTAAVPNLVVLGATSLNALVWLLDGFVVYNDRLMVPHGVGVGSCLIQIAIYLCCSKINSKKAPRSTSTSPLHERLLEEV